MKKRLTVVVLALCMVLSLLPAGALAASMSGGQGGTQCPEGRHVWDSGVTTPQSDCQNPGYITYTCKVCSATKREELSAVHSWDGGKITTPATTASTGVKTYTCTACGATKTEIIPIRVPVPSTPNTARAGDFLQPVTAISDTADSIAVSSYADLCRVGTDDAHPLDGSYYLTADISIPADAVWTPIGRSEDAPFTGTFDGQGHFITGLIFSCADAARNMTGLQGYGIFGVVESASIRNLGVDGVDIHAGADQCDVPIGGIVGKAIESVIDNCTAFGTILRDGAQSPSGGTGGISGSALGSRYTVEQHTKFLNCLADVNITVQYEKDGVITPEGSAGGICSGGYDTDYRNCVCGRGNSTQESGGIRAETAGGIAAWADPNSKLTITIESCVNRKPVTGGEYTGGIVGSGSPQTSDCHNHAVVTGVGRVGGIIGYNSGGAAMKDCTNDGDVIMASPDKGGYAGGIVGYSDSGDITDCSNSANVSITVNNVAACFAGGIAGRFNGSDSHGMHGCKNTGGVSAFSSPVDGSGEEMAVAGGVCGEVYTSNCSLENPSAAVINDCSNTGDVGAHIACTDGDAYAGGILGRAETAFVTVNENRLVWIHISDCTSSGRVNAVSNYDHTANKDKLNYIMAYVGARAYAGGIGGWAMQDVLFTKCFADGAQLSAKVDDPNNSESYPRRAATASVSGGLPQVEGARIVNGWGYNNTAISIQNNAGEYMTRGSSSKARMSAFMTGATDYQRFRLVTCSDGAFAIQSCENMRYLSHGLVPILIDATTPGYDADFSAPAISGSGEKFRFVKYNPDTGNFEDADFQALSETSAGFICFIMSDNGLLLGADENGLYESANRNKATLFTITAIGSFNLATKTQLGILHNPQWLDLDGSGQGGFWDIQNELGSGQTTTLQRLGYEPMNWVGWRWHATAQNANIIKIGNMECTVGVKIRTDGGYDVIVDFQGTGGYGGGSNYRDAMSNLTNDIVEAQHKGYRAMAYKLIDERFSVRLGNGLTLEDLIVKAATDGSAHFTILGHSMGGAIAQSFALYLATKRGIDPAEIRGRTFESALVLADDGGNRSSDTYYATFTDWYNLCVDSDSVSCGTVTGSILSKCGIHRLGYTVTLEDPYPDRDVDLDIFTGIVQNKHNMDRVLEKILRAHKSHDLGSGTQSLQNEAWSYEAANLSGVLGTCPDSGGFTNHTIAFPIWIVYTLKADDTPAYKEPDTASSVVRRLKMDKDKSVSIYGYTYDARGEKFYEIGDDATTDEKDRLWVEGDKLVSTELLSSPLTTLQKIPCDQQFIVVADGERLYSRPSRDTADGNVIRQMKKYEFVKAEYWALDTDGHRWYKLADPNSGWVTEETVVPPGVSNIVDNLQYKSRILCPVDITVQDASGAEVLTIVDNKVTKNTTGGKIVPLILNDEKQLYFYDGAQYNIIIKATDADTFTYILDGVNASGTYGAEKAFRFADLTAGKTLTTTVGGGMNAADAELLVLNSSGNPVSRVETNGTETPLSVSGSGLSSSSVTTAGGLSVTTPAGSAPVTGKDGVTTLPGGGTVKTAAGTLNAPAGTAVTPDGTVTIPNSASGTLTLPGGTSILLSGGASISGKNVSVGPGGAKASFGNGGADSFGPGTVIIQDEDVPLGFRLQWKNPFTDIDETAWYYDGVSFVCMNGLLTGTSGTSFSPELTMTRGMLVTALWRMEGSPAGKATAFSDVASGKYCFAAVAWASENGIVGGYGSGRFGPDDAVTREQMVTIFFRYAQFKGLGVSSAESLDRYSDCALVSAYARPAMAWAVGCGLVKGSGGSLLPGSPASRAQAAVILQRFSQNVAK